MASVPVSFNLAASPDRLPRGIIGIAPDPDVVWPAPIRESASPRRGEGGTRGRPSACPGGDLRSRRPTTDACRHGNRPRRKREGRLRQGTAARTPGVRKCSSDSSLAQF
jgi:hypothetical protein